MDATLAIKITTLVEGLKGVAQLGQEFLNTAQEAQQLGRKTVDATGDMDRAFQSLGGRSIKQVQAEISKVREALENVKGSGASFEDIARATELAQTRVARLNQELKDPSSKTMAERFSSLGEKIKSADFGGAAKEINGMATSLGGVGTVLANTVAGFVAAKAVSFLKDLIADTIQFAVEGAKLAARVETLGITLQAVGRNAGYSAEGLNKAEAQVKAMGITTEAARDSLTKMIQAGIGVNDLSKTIDEKASKMAGYTVFFTKAQELSRAAQDLAVVTGENSSQTLQRMIVNIQQMDTMGLRFMGLSVSREAAEAKFAISVGKSASALSETEKKQAFYNATMLEAKKLQGTYENALEAVGKKQASLTRYQEEFSRTVGEMLLPAYAAVVDAQTKYNSQAQKTAEKFAETTQLAPILGKSVGALSDVFAALGVSAVDGGLKIGESLARAFSGLSELAAPLLKSIEGVLDVINALGQSVGIDEFASKLNPIAGLFNGIGLILAVVKDAIVVAFSVGVEVVSFFTGALGGVIQAVGFLSGIVNTKLGASIREFGQGLTETSKNMDGWAKSMIAGVVSSEGATARWAKSFEAGNNAISKTSEYSRKLSKDMEDLASAQRTGSISAEDLTAKYDAIVIAIKKAGDEGKISAKEMINLNKQTASIPGTLASAFDEAQKAAGVSLSELRSNLTKEASASASYLEKLLEAGTSKLTDVLSNAGTTVKTFGDDFVRAYEKMVPGAKTLQDLENIDKNLSKAFTSGLISIKQFEEGLNASTKQFDKLFAAQLKTTDSKQGFEDLTKTIKKMGEEGVLSGTQVAQSLQLIAEKQDGIKEASKRRLDQERETSSESLKLAQSHFDVIKAETDVMKSRVGVWVAEAKFQMSGNELDQIGVAIAKLDYEIAVQQLALQRIKNKEQQADYDLKLAKQRLLNAEIALSFDVNNEGLQKQAASAQKVVEAQDRNVKEIQLQVDKQTTLLLKTQETQYIAKGTQEILKMQSDAQKQTTTAVGETVTGMQKLDSASQGVQGTMGSFGPTVSKAVVTIGEAVARTDGLNKSVGAVGGSFAGVNSEATKLDSSLGTVAGSLTGINGDIVTAHTSIEGVNVAFGDTRTLLIGLQTDSSKWSDEVQIAYGKSIELLDKLKTARLQAMEAMTGQNYGSSGGGVAQGFKTSTTKLGGTVNSNNGNTASSKSTDASGNKYDSQGFAMSGGSRLTGSSYTPPPDNSGNWKFVNGGYGSSIYSGKWVPTDEAYAQAAKQQLNRGTGAVGESQAPVGNDGVQDKINIDNSNADLEKRAIQNGGVHPYGDRPLDPANLGNWNKYPSSPAPKSDPLPKYVPPSAPTPLPELTAKPGGRNIDTWVSSFLDSMGAQSIARPATALTPATSSTVEKSVRLELVVDGKTAKLDTKDGDTLDAILSALGKAASVYSRG